MMRLQNWQKNSWKCCGYKQNSCWQLWFDEKNWHQWQIDRNDSKIKIKVWLTKQFILRNSSCSSVCLFHYQSVGIMFQILQFTVDSFVLKQQTKRAIIGNTLGANSGSVWRMLCVSTSKVASWRKSLRATLALTQPWRILSRRRNCCLIFSTYWHSTGSFAWFVNQGIA